LHRVDTCLKRREGIEPRFIAPNCLLLTCRGVSNVYVGVTQDSAARVCYRALDSSG
jgi:hypothetical protein